MVSSGLLFSERKRVAVAIELVTNPFLIVLDEPTSGLDSRAALHLVKLLRREAQSGKTVLCSVHQPSSELFSQFDRMIFMHEGAPIYSGPVTKLKPYLNRLNVDVPKYVNPADLLTRIVVAPANHAAGLSIEKLVSKCKIDLTKD